MPGKCWLRRGRCDAARILPFRGGGREAVGGAGASFRGIAVDLDVSERCTGPSTTLRAVPLP